jgi:hypothetical protein
MHLKKSEMNSENIGYIYIWKRQSGTYSGMGIQWKHHKNYKVKGISQFKSKENKNI